MKFRQRKKVYLIILKKKVEELNYDIFNKNASTKYKIELWPEAVPKSELKTVYFMNKKIRFEVRENEGHHNIAHFHVTVPGEGSGSYRISDLSPIHTDLNRKIENKILEWASANRDLLVSVWNDFHGYRITVA